MDIWALHLVGPGKASMAGASPTSHRECSHHTRPCRGAGSQVPHRAVMPPAPPCLHRLSAQASTSTLHDLTGLVAPRWAYAAHSSLHRPTPPPSTTSQVWWLHGGPRPLGRRHRPTLSHSQTDYATLLPSAPELLGVAGGSRSSVIALRSDGTAADLGLKREFFEFRTSNFEIFPSLPPLPPEPLAPCLGSSGDAAAPDSPAEPSVPRLSTDCSRKQ